MESPHFTGMFTQLFYLVANKEITDMTQNEFCLIAENFGFVKDLKQIKLNYFN